MIAATISWIVTWTKGIAKEVPIGMKNSETTPVIMLSAALTIVPMPAIRSHGRII